ncbi:hypothetical protein [Archangium lipolyticum]|uniref:hypothetical protein n=1 Tax=Archangium lipolyticum TaxID=2970465 RepID=UPI002149BAB5|nr:hypothetical protein [Archangium lipolyticum]
MRKPTWWDFGIAVLGLFLVCGATRSLAQDAQYPGTGSTVQQPTQGSDVPGATDATGGSGQAEDTGQQTTGNQQMSSVDARQLQEIARLRAEVARLQLELARMRSQLVQAQQAGGAGQGVGGSGSAGIGDPNAEAPAGATGLGDPNAEAPARAQESGTPVNEGVGGGGAGGAQARPDTDNQGYAVANVIYTGRVRSVSQQRLVLVDDAGAANTLSLAPNVRVLRQGQQVSLQSIQEGTVVRASASLYTRGNPVTEIEVVPPARARTR